MTSRPHRAPKKPTKPTRKPPRIAKRDWQRPLDKADAQPMKRSRP